MFQIRAKLIYNKRVKDNYFHMGLKALGIAKEAQPGQFVNIRISDSGEPLLRRPFGIHRIVQGSWFKVHDQRVKGLRVKRYELIEILYEVLGKGTEILSRKKAGEYLDVIGPLGKGFDYGAPVTSHQSPVLVAGGMGVAPLIFLAEKLVQSSKFKVQRKPPVFLGARTKKQILCEEEFRKLGCEVKISTDDGSKGFKGKVTDLLREFLRTTDDGRMRSEAKPPRRGRTTIYACGPRPMLKEISRIAKQYHLPAQISLEEHMACGIGVCLGCVVKVTSDFEYKRVCKEGPVFDSGQICW